MKITITDTKIIFDGEGITTIRVEEHEEFQELFKIEGLDDREIVVCNFSVEGVKDKNNEY